MLIFFRYILCLLSVFLWAESSFAGVEPYQNFLKGSIKIGDSLTVKDEKFKNTAFNWIDISNISVKNRIELKVIQEQVISENFDCVIQLRVEYFSTPEQISATIFQNVELNVSYRVGEGVKHKLIDNFTFSGGHSVKIYVTNISSQQYGQNVPAILQLTNSILIDRQYKFLGAAPFNFNGLSSANSSSNNNFFGRLLNPETSLVNSGHQLNLEWSMIQGAEEFDIEWTTVDVPGDFDDIIQRANNNLALESEVDAVFRNNATRITTDQQTYNISLVYNSSYIIVRYRQVSYDPITGLRNEGLWQYKQSDDTFAIWQTNWHEENLNWQFNVSFAEQGKKKEVVGYFDGTLRNKQSVTLKNGETDDVAIIQENMYDEFGREFINVLPTPYRDSNLAKQHLRYFPSFNINHSNTPQGFSFRDIGNNDCGIFPLDSLSNQSGAAQYYSGLNSFANSEYVPDAKSYPFSMVQYTADNTNRIQLQGGVGRFFTPGILDNKATRYYFGKPEQWELDRIFGNDVGYAEHYLKHTTVDANGQVSLSYTNSNGQTIATALSGASPKGLSAIQSYVDTSSYVSTLIKPEQFAYDPATKRFSADATFVATSIGEVNVRFNINKLVYTFSNGSTEICSNCHYTLIAKVVDNCNEIKVQSQFPINIGSKIPDSAGIGLQFENFNFFADRIGEYFISFEMQIDDKVVENYVENYISKIDTSGLLRKEHTFVRPYLDSLNFNNLYNDCRTAVNELGTRVDFLTKLKNNLKVNGIDSNYVDGVEFGLYVDSIYTNLYAHVINLEAGCNTLPCETVKSQLLDDVSPNGQFALFDDQFNPLETSINVLYNNFRSVFPILDSTHVNYKLNLVTFENGKVLSPHDVNFDISDLAKYWRSGWASLFLDKHPEYCRLQACESTQSYLSWDEKLSKLYNKSVDISRISHGATYSVSNGHWLVDYDPFFQGLGTAYKAEMELDLDLYSRRILKLDSTGFNDKNLSQYVSYNLYCADSNSITNPNNANSLDRWDNCAPFENCRSLDREWNDYKELYLGLKQKYYNILTENSYCNSNSLANCVPQVPYDYGTQQNPGIRDFSFSVDSVGERFQYVSIKAVNGVVNQDKLIWFDEKLITDHKNLRNFAILPQYNDVVVFHLPVGIPLSDLRIKKVQDGPFSYKRIYLDDYFELKNLYETELGDIYYEFGLRPNKFPPSNSFDVNGQLHGFAFGPNLGWSGYGYSDLYFNSYNEFSFTLENPSWDETAYVEGYVDFPIYSNQDSNCLQEMANKITRFPTGGGFAPGYTPVTSVIVNQGNQQLAELIKSSCEVAATNWMNLLEPGLLSVQATSSQRNDLRNRLLEVCKLGGSESNPMGTSTLPNNQSTVFNDSSFGSAIKTIFGNYTSLLNPWVIDSPRPHDSKSNVIQNTISNTNEDICAKINTLRPLGYTDLMFYNYLISTYGSAMNINESEFYELLKSCGSCKYLLNYDVKLPFLFEPSSKACITKSEFLQAKSDLFDSVPGGLNLVQQDSLTYSNIVANYMNQKFGFGFSYDQYRLFEGDVNRTLLCNEATFGDTKIDAFENIKALIAIAVTNGKNEYSIYLANERDAFRQNYINMCKTARPSVQLRANNQIFHYTLYYYDQKGNLVRTVPPEGVKILTVNEIENVNRFRNGTLSSCTSGPQENAIKAVALQKLADVLNRPNKAAVEQWVYTGDQGRQFIVTTPERDFIFNTCISGDYVNVDIYSITTNATSATITLSNHISANIRGILPLQSWTHIVVQGKDLAKSNLELYINGSRFAAVDRPSNFGCSWQIKGDPLVFPENMGIIKDLRLYSRLMTPFEIAQNSGSACRNVTNPNAMEWYKFNFLVEDNLPTPIYPDHLLKTNYVYNGINKVVKQTTPDAGLTSFYYDDLGRLVFSQNAKQAIGNKLSYTLYDRFSRVEEVGQLDQGFYLGEYYSGYEYLFNWEIKTLIKSNYLNKEQVTQTYYDNPITGWSLFTPFAQTNLNKRVSATTYKDTQAGEPQQVSYYSYDIAGNVSSLGQFIAGLGHKKLDYEYDLVSGKVNFLAYQHNRPDAFYYKYDYDSENKLIKAWSGTEAQIKNFGGSYLINGRLDAEYFYYLHGPLRRLELGDEENKVQGIDYAYTLQGWLKGVNGTGLGQNDIGNDGATIGKDVLAYSLGYYQGDYTPIGGISANAFSHVYQSDNLSSTGRNLYNGNISHSTYAIGGINGGATVGYTYGYDQLNRLKNMRQHTLGSAGNWDFTSVSHNFKENFDYDGNGNLLKLTRFNGNGAIMDSLYYNYNRNSSDHLINNRLSSIANNVSVTGSVAGTSYTYDQIGNLTGDQTEGITNINWTVYGKIKQINKSTGNINYSYDAIGNRVSKTYNGTNTYYVRDAQGNTLAVYDRKANTSTIWREQHLYGSSRLGTWKPDIDESTGDSQTWDTIGKKHYELVNHLGNVMAVVSDSRGLIGGSYAAQLLNSNDYYAFGSQMPGRNYTLAGTYRYGFGGHEKDDEVKGAGNHLSFGDYGYDTRIGRRWNVDPKFNEIAGISPYAYALDNPIVYIDKDGELPILPLLLKAGAAGAADMLTQAAVAYFFDPKVQSAGQAFEKVNWLQVARSSAEGLIPWRTPGGKLGKAAATAIGDVLVNAVSEGSNYSGEQALQDFAVGFIGDLAGGEIGEFVSKYGAKGVAKGLSKMGFDDKKIEEILTGAGTTWKGPADYSDIPDPKNVGAGLPFKNKKHRDAIFDKNKSTNNGHLRDDTDGTFLNKGTKGGSDPKQAEIDHKRAKSRGGDNSSKNAQVLSKENNRRKGTN